MKLNFRTLSLTLLLLTTPLAAVSYAHGLNITLDQCGQVDPHCVEKVSDACYHSTALGYDGCYQQVVESHGCQTLGFAECVKDTSKYCYEHTTQDSSHCYDQALSTCKGSR